MSEAGSEWSVIDVEWVPRQLEIGLISPVRFWKVTCGVLINAGSAMWSLLMRRVQQA